MDKQDGGAWLIVWDIAKSVIAAMGAVVTGFGLYLLRAYSSDRAMLLRHDKKFEQDDKELGEQRAFRIEAGKGPIGDKLNAAILKLEEEDRRLHRRISIKQRDISQLKEDMVEVMTDLKWIRNALGDTEQDE